MEKHAVWLLAEVDCDLDRSDWRHIIHNGILPGDLHLGVIQEVNEYLATFLPQRHLEWGRRFYPQLRGEDAFDNRMEEVTCSRGMRRGEHHSHGTIHDGNLSGTQCADSRGALAVPGSIVRRIPIADHLHCTGIHVLP